MCHSDSWREGSHPTADAVGFASGLVVAWFAQKNRLFGKKASPLDVSYVAIL